MQSHSVEILIIDSNTHFLYGTCYLSLNGLMKEIHGMEQNEDENNNNNNNNNNLNNNNNNNYYDENKREENVFRTHTYEYVLDIWAPLSPYTSIINNNINNNNTNIILYPLLFTPYSGNGFNNNNNNNNK